MSNMSTFDKSDADKALCDGVIVADALCTHTTSSLSLVIERSLLDCALKVAYTVTRLSGDAARSGKSRFVFIRCLTTESDVVMPLSIHPTWEKLSVEWVKKTGYSPTNAGVGKVDVYPVTSTCSVLTTLSDVLTHTCKCGAVYFADVNRIWCTTSHMRQKSVHDKDILVHHWDHMSHDNRTRLLKTFAPLADDDFEPTCPMTKKLWTILKGRVDVSGGTLMECLEEATEGTHLIRVSEADLKKHIMPDLTHSPRDILALVAHHILTSLAQSFASANASRLVEELEREERQRMKKRTTKQKRNHMRWVEKTMFASDYRVPWDLVE